MLWLGVDVGTSGLKALLVNEEGEVEASYTVEYGMRRPSRAGQSRSQRAGGRLWLKLWLSFALKFPS